MLETYARGTQRLCVYLRFVILCTKKKMQANNLMMTTWWLGGTMCVPCPIYLTKIYLCITWTFVLINSSVTCIKSTTVHALISIHIKPTLTTKHFGNTWEPNFFHLPLHSYIMQQSIHNGERRFQRSLSELSLQRTDN